MNTAATSGAGPSAITWLTSVTFKMQTELGFNIAKCSNERCNLWSLLSSHRNLGLAALLYVLFCLHRPARRLKVRWYPTKFTLIKVGFIYLYVNLARSWWGLSFWNSPGFPHLLCFHRDSQSGAVWTLILPRLLSALSSDSSYILVTVQAAAPAALPSGGLTKITQIPLQSISLLSHLSRSWLTLFLWRSIGFKQMEWDPEINLIHRGRGFQLQVPMGSLKELRYLKWKIHAALYK